MKINTYFNGTTVFAMLIALLSPILLFAPVSVSAGVNQCSWSGGGADDNWSTDANWTCSVGTGPTTGYDLIFPFSDTGGSVTTLVNDLSSANSYAGIWFTGDTTGCTGSSSIWITGNDIILAGDILSQQTGNCSTNGHSILTNLTFTSPAVISGSSVASIVIGDNFGGAQTINAGSHNLEFRAAWIFNTTITGTGDLTFANPDAINRSVIFGGTNNMSGNLIIDDVSVTSQGVGSAIFGTGAGTTTIEDGGAIIFQLIDSCTIVDVTTSENITINGSGPNGINPRIGGSACGTGYFTDISYVDTVLADFDITLNGTLTLGSNIDIYTQAGNFNINGPIVGAFTITPPALYPGWTGAINIASSSNGSSTPNGTYQHPSRSITLSDSLPGTSITAAGGYQVTVTGQRGDVEVKSGGVLLGDGTIANLTSEGGVLRPGLSPGIMTTGNLDFDAATELDIELEGTTPGAGGHDQYNVTGTVSLGSATLNTILFNGYAPSLNDTFTIINNDGSDAVVGTFGGLAEGASFAVGSYQFTISYAGGTGNDVVLTTSFEPGPPGTGFGILQNSLFAPIALVLAGLSVVGFANRRRFALKK